MNHIVNAISAVEHGERKLLVSMTKEKLAQTIALMHGICDAMNVAQPPRDGESAPIYEQLTREQVMALGALFFLGARNNFDAHTVDICTDLADEIRAIVEEKTGEWM